MDLAILGLTVSSVSATGAIIAAVSFWLNRGKVEERADQALARAKEGNDRYDKIMAAFADYRVAMAADIAIVKTLTETNTAALASAENRLAAAIEQMNARFGELNQRIDRLLDGREDNRDNRYIEQRGSREINWGDNPKIARAH